VAEAGMAESAGQGAQATHGAVDGERTAVVGRAPFPPAREWLVYGDAMRVFGVLAVLLVHTCDLVMFDRQVKPLDWWVANVLDATGRWAVPVFIMLSGALLLNPSRDESAGRFYRRRLSRLGLPILFWSAFFMAFAVHYTHWRSGSWGAEKSVWTDLLKGQPYMHLHFVFRLAGLYAITPMLRVYVRHASWGLRARMAGLLLALGIGNWAVTPLFVAETTAFSSFWSFLCFYLLGDVLRGVKATRRLFGWSLAAFAVSWAGMAVGTYHLAPTPYGGLRYFPQAADLMLYDFLSPFRVLMSIAAWFILAYLFGRIPRETAVQRVLGWLAPLTLGIYLVHPLFREVMYQNGLGFSQPSVWVGIPLSTLALVMLSTGLTHGLRCIPGLRRIMG
jgi:surface polysaccharide O-acyltransferase-like enzyme